MKTIFEAGAQVKKLQVENCLHIQYLPKVFGSPRGPYAKTLFLQSIEYFKVSFEVKKRKSKIPLFSAPTPLFFRWRERKQGMEAEQMGILLFRFLTSNETLKYQSKKFKIRPDIKLTQVDFFENVAFP
jgi:hypothetical protein